MVDGWVGEWEMKTQNLRTFWVPVTCIQPRALPIRTLKPH